MQLAQFQFDYDLTFAAFFLNADGTVYGRFGSRSNHHDAARDITLAGFREALAGALKLHRNFAAVKSALAAKKGPAPKYQVPEAYPSLKRFNAKLDYQGQVAKSCMHCHQVREAQRRDYRDRGKPIPEEVLYPWPMPDVVGLKLDPKYRATVAEVLADSVAAKAGFQAGDAIVSLEGQPLLSIADVQWVLHQAQPPTRLKAEVQRDGKTLKLELPLEPGWRRAADISWRPTTWDLRRMATGGLVLEDAQPKHRQDAGLPDNVLCLRVRHVGQYGAHAVAKKAGFQQGDLIVSFDGLTEPLSETDLMSHAVTKRSPGDKVPVVVIRNGKRIELTLPLQ